MIGFSRTGFSLSAVLTKYKIKTRQAEACPTRIDSAYRVFEEVFSAAGDITPAGIVFFFRDFGTEGSAAGESCIGRLKRRIPS